MKPRIGYFSDSYANYFWFLLLTLSLTRISARLADSPVTAAKPVHRNEPVEGSGSFGGNESHEEQEWHASGLSPDDEPGDDGDEDDERREASGDVVEGSGAPVQNIASKTLEIHTTVTPSTALQTTTETHSVPQQSTARPLFDVTPSTTPPTTTTTTVKPVIQYTTTTSTVTTTTRKPAVVVNTRPPPPQIKTPYISEMEQPFEMLKPGILAAVSGGAVVGVLMTILLIMFIIYRMRKKDEGSYSLDEPHQPPNYSYAYQKASTKEFYA